MTNCSGLFRFDYYAIIGKNINVFDIVWNNFVQWNVRGDFTFRVLSFYSHPTFLVKLKNLESGHYFISTKIACLLYNHQYSHAKSLTDLLKLSSLIIIFNVNDENLIRKKLGLLIIGIEWEMCIHTSETMRCIYKLRII